MKKLLVCMSVVLLLSCKKDAQNLKEETGSERFVRLSGEWCQTFYNTDCKRVCVSNQWGTKGNCNVMLSGGIKNLQCNIQGCVIE